MLLATGKFQASTLGCRDHPRSCRTDLADDGHHASVLPTSLVPPVEGCRKCQAAVAVSHASAFVLGFD